MSLKIDKNTYSLEPKFYKNVVKICKSIDLIFYTKSSAPGGCDSNEVHFFDDICSNRGFTAYGLIWHIVSFLDADIFFPLSDFPLF